MYTDTSVSTAFWLARARNKTVSRKKKRARNNTSITTNIYDCFEEKQASCPFWSPPSQLVCLVGVSWSPPHGGLAPRRERNSWPGAVRDVGIAAATVPTSSRVGSRGARPINCAHSLGTIHHQTLSDTTTIRTVLAIIFACCSICSFFLSFRASSVRG